MHRAASALALCLLLAACDSGTDTIPTIDNQSPAAFEKSVKKMRAALSSEDAERLDGILTANKWKGQQAKIDGQTAAQLFAQAEADEKAEKQKTSKYQQLMHEMEAMENRQVTASKLSDEEYKSRRQAILKQIKDLGIPMPDSAFEK